MNSAYSKFNFDLPEHLIAKFPASNRDSSRLMVIHRSTSEITIEPSFREVLKYLTSTDTLVFNSTKVSKRRVFLENDKGKIFEIIFMEALDLQSGQDWICLIRNQSKLQNGDRLFHKKTNHMFTYFKLGNQGILKPDIELTEMVFDEIGNIPIPPYLKREATPEDEIRYQTIFAKNPGSVAAPTAGLHFTEELKLDMIQKGVNVCEIELQIGYGTFASLNENNFLEKKLHSEKYQISTETAKILNESRVVGRVISVGTTTLRGLESSYEKVKMSYESINGSTDLFILPDDTIHSIDGLITNFHLPGSSLLFLVSAFAGEDLILEAYQIAIKEKMRFYSYGDAMLIL